jgi:hypothetical protein
LDAPVLAERLGSGDGERKTLLTRQIAFEPPACIRFVRLWFCEWHRKGFDLGVKLSRSLENEMAL